MSSEENKQHFDIQKIYVKDISFEAPDTPEVFSREWKPEVNLQLNSQAKPVGDRHYEVVLSITVTAKNGDKTAFLVEIQQAGVFHMEGFAEQERGGMLGSFCPNILFPYAREAISDLVTRGGFPQLLLAPVNFDALYAEHLRQQAEPVKEEEATTH